MKNKLKAIIFDFDGVIAESVNVKTEAFAEMYKVYGSEVSKKVVEHHLLNGGMSRFEKFAIYHKDFLGKDIDQDEIDRLSRIFSELVVTKVINAPYVMGALEFLMKNHEKYEFFVSTGTPTNEIKVILKQRKIYHLFKAVYGSPEKKSVHVNHILLENKLANSEVIFIGDAIADKVAAVDNDIAFIARITAEDTTLNDEKYQIHDFNELDMMINQVFNSDNEG